GLFWGAVGAGRRLASPLSDGRDSRQATSPHTARAAPGGGPTPHGRHPDGTHLARSNRGTAAGRRDAWGGGASGRAAGAGGEPGQRGERRNPGERRQLPPRPERRRAGRRLRLGRYEP